MGENTLMRSIGIGTKWAITIQCDISEAMEMKQGLSFVLLWSGYTSDSQREHIYQLLSMFRVLGPLPSWE